MVKFELFYDNLINFWIQRSDFIWCFRLIICMIIRNLNKIKWFSIANNLFVITITVINVSNPY